MKKIYLDTETTGLSPGQITQISYIIEEGQAIIKRVNQYFKVESIDDGAARATGLSVEKLNFLSEGTRFEHRAHEIYTDLSDGVLVAHNAAFDTSFLQAEFQRVGLMYIPKKVLCTMKHMTDIMKIPKARGAGFKYPKLEEIMRYTGVTHNQVLGLARTIFGNYAMQEHDSRFDASALWSVCKVLEQRGVLNIEDEINITI